MCMIVALLYINLTVAIFYYKLAFSFDFVWNIERFADRGRGLGGTAGVGPLLNLRCGDCPCLRHPNISEIFYFSHKCPRGHLL